MPFKLDAIVTLVAMAAASLILVPAKAQQAAAPADRCEGTLCDLYYGGPKPTPAPGSQAAAPAPLVVPRPTLFGGPTQTQNGAPATRPMVGVGGGGLASMARGDAQDRCEGTLCDLYYGGPKKPAPTPATAPAGTTAAVPVTPEPDAEPEPGVVHGRMVESREAPPRCVNKQDPWKCFR